MGAHGIEPRCAGLIELAAPKDAENGAGFHGLAAFSRTSLTYAVNRLPFALALAVSFALVPLTGHASTRSRLS